MLAVRGGEAAWREGCLCGAACQTVRVSSELMVAREMWDGHNAIGAGTPGGGLLAPGCFAWSSTEFSRGLLRMEARRLGGTIGLFGG